MKAKTLFLALLLLTGAAAASDVRNLTMDGRQRVYRVYRPAGLARTKPVPLVVMLHGAFGTGAQAERAYGWDAAADRAGFVVAYPDGMRRTWNAGGACCGRAHSEGVNDVAFLNRAIDTVVRDENIDMKRVYVTGMSNGGAMTYRYACEGSFPIAAIGPVASSFTYSCDKPHNPVPVLAIHGLADKTVPYGGGLGRRGRNITWLPVQASLDVFRDADVCNAPTLEQNGVVVTSTAKCDKGREVELITVADAGHQWPGSKREDGLFAGLLKLDPPSTALDATSVLWAFFARHPAD
jgi:polyhydroxybutyrate depolymerase